MKRDLIYEWQSARSLAECLGVRRREVFMAACFDRQVEGHAIDRRRQLPGEIPWCRDRHVYRVKKRQPNPH